MRKTLTFAVTDTPEALFGVENDQFTTRKTGSENGIVLGEYEYESEDSFGGSIEADGELYWDDTNNLIAIVTYHDNPKPTTLFRRLSEATDTEISAPEYPQEASEQFYHTFGFNGYTTSFREDLRTYGPHSSYQYIEPDEKMENQATHSRRNPSDEWLEEITNDLAEDHYVALMDFVLEENGNSYSFSNPMRITGIPEDEFDMSLLKLIFQRMNELYENRVPTTEEVLS